MIGTDALTRNHKSQRFSVQANATVNVAVCEDQDGDGKAGAETNLGSVLSATKKMKMSIAQIFYGSVNDELPN